MNWRIGLAALLLLWSAAAAARHSSNTLDPRRATPGIRLELIELPASASAGTTKYRLHAEGVPRGVMFGVWTKDFGQPFTQVFSGFRIDEAGALMSVDDSGQPRRLEDIALDPGPYPKGAVWMVALASDDQTQSAFAKIIPHPIAARDGACSVSLELISLHGNRFVASGVGFVPNEDVDIELRSSGRVNHRKERVSAEGLLPLDVVSHGAISTDLSASYLVKARSCGPEVQYEWGDAALKRQ
jgi:hypothetical protein